nr:MFS transporter [Maricaulis parjimensis]
MTAPATYNRTGFMTDFSQEPRSGAPHSASESYRNVAAVVAALALLQMAAGALSVVGPLSLISQGASSLKIGIIVAGYATGFLLGATLAPREIARIGHIRAIAGFAAATSIAVAALYLSSATAWWLVMQFIMGLCVASFLAAGESWVADSAPPERRGAILAFYLVSAKIGFIIGPFLVAGIEPGVAAGFLVVAALYTASLIPAAATNRAQPAPPTSESFGPRKVFQIAPSAIIAAFAAGMVNGPVMQLYAVFVGGMETVSVTQTAALFNAFLVGGSVLAQWPAGMLSDRMDRRVVIAGLALVAGVSALGLGLFSGVLPVMLIFAVAGLWGAGAQSYYGIAVAHAADRAPEGQATNMMSGILTMYGLGTMIGPVIAGVVMALIGPSGLFLYASIILFALFGAMLYRRGDKAPVNDADKSDFEPISATSVAVYDLTELASEEDPDAPAPASSTQDEDEDDDENYWER